MAARCLRVFYGRDCGSQRLTKNTAIPQGSGSKRGLEGESGQGKHALQSQKTLTKGVNGILKQAHCQGPKARGHDDATSGGACRK